MHTDRYRITKGKMCWWVFPPYSRWGAGYESFDDARRAVIAGIDFRKEIF